MIPFQRSIYFKNLILQEVIFLATKPMAQKRFGIGLHLNKHPTPFRLRRIVKIHGKSIGIGTKNATWLSAFSIKSSIFAAWQLVMTNWQNHSCRLYT
ncbi:hypothetical protein PPE_03063 [Paenibacillus polymyxa E681]|nr:hypothetical protein PPE_03063 [Paenibacillus polymyxa E681]